MFSPYNFEENEDIVFSYFKDEWINSIKIDKINLTDETKFRLNEITKIENYFIEEINQKKLCIKKLGKYVAAFGCIDKLLITLSATNGGVSIISFTSVVGAPVGITNASFALIFSLTIGIIKKLLSITRNKKKKHDQILMLVNSKLNNTETLVSQALIDIEISHEEFDTIKKEKKKYEKMKENVRNVNEKQENMRLNSVNSKTKKSRLWIVYVTCDFNWLQTFELKTKV